MFLAPRRWPRRGWRVSRRPRNCLARRRGARGQIEPLGAPRDAKNLERLAWDVRRGMSSILNHPWIPTTGADAVTVRGFVYDVDTARLDEVSYPGPMGSIG